MSSIMPPATRDSLEVMVDRFGLSQVLDKLAEVCREKAAHIEENWQDNTLAREWDKAAGRIENLDVSTVAR